MELTHQGEVFRLERELVGILNGYARKLEARLGMINTYLDVSMNSSMNMIFTIHYYLHLIFETMSGFREKEKRTRQLFRAICISTCAISFCLSLFPCHGILIPRMSFYASSSLPSFPCFPQTTGHCSFDFGTYFDMSLVFVDDS